MKRSLFTQHLKQTLLAVPASALMLGAAHAGSTIGLNFQQWYYDSGNNPQTIGSCNGYSTYNATGMPVTAKAFGVSPASWSNTDPIGSAYNASAINQLCTFGGVATTFAGGLSCNVNSPNGTRGSGIDCPFASGSTYPAYTPGEFAKPGNDEVFWGNIQGNAANPFSVSVSGLTAKFPNGYVIQAMGAKGGYAPLSIANLADVFFTDGVTTDDSTYHCTVVNNPSVAQWGQTLVGVSDPSGVFNSNNITIYSQDDNAALSGFIITDQPVVSQDPVGGTYAAGIPFTLTPSVAALPNGLFYQWRKNGTPISGANSATYTKAVSTSADSGNYDLVVTNLYGSATSQVASVTVAINTWNVPATIAGDTDVATNGTSVFAYAWSSNSTSVNTVNFTAPDVGATLSGFAANYGGYGSSITTLSSDYQNTVTGGQYASGATACTVTLNSLTSSHQYLVQLWVDDSRSGFGSRTETVTLGGNTVTLKYTSSNSAGGVGQYAIGTFIASATTQVITLTGNASTQINALQLRDLGIPAIVPTPVFTPAGGLYLGAQNVTITGSGKIFYTTDGTTPTYSSAVYSSPITVPAGVTMTINAFGTNTAQADSSVASATYTTFASPAVPTWITAAGGSWTNTANWSNNVVANGSGATADFSTLNLTADATVTLDGAPTVGKLVFGDTTPDHNWILNAGTGGPLTLASGTTPAITVNNQTTTINAVLAGTQGLNKTGAGYLTLAGANSYSGTATVLAGTLEAQAKNGDAPYIVTNGATLKIGYNTGVYYTHTALTIYGDGAAATTGLYLLGGTRYAVDCNTPGGLTVAGAPTTIRQYGSGLASIGTFDVNPNPGLSITAAASGSVIDSNIQMVSAGYGVVVTTSAGANTATGDLTINGPLNVGSLGFYKRGSGSVLFNAAALPGNLALHLQGGTAICGATDCIGANAILDVSAGSTLNLNGHSQTVTNATATGLAGTIKMTIYTGGTPSATVLTTTDPGTALTYGGTLTVTSVGTAPTIGQKFTLFNSADGYSGGFTSFNLPPFDTLAWDTSGLTVDGSITVIAGSVPPSITTDLAGGTIYAYPGTTVRLSIVAAGDPTLHYHWTKNGTTPVGTDSPTLTLTSVTTGSTGDYAVTVTNPWGTSSPSTTTHLTVVTPSLVGAAMTQDTPLSFWPLNETSPSTAYDYWSGNNGAQNGSLTLGATGPVPPTDAGFNVGTTAYQFDGSSTYIDCGTNASLSGTTDFTVEAWINTTNATGSSTIIQQRSTSGYDGTANGYNGEYEFQVNGNGTLYFMLYGGGGYQFSFSSPRISRRVNDGQWHHVAAVRSGSNGFIYVDGSLVASASGTAEPLDGTIATFIGEDQRNSSGYFNGAMCDVAVYTTALSADRIGVHAATGVLGTAPLRLNIVTGGWTEDSKPVGVPHDGQNLGTTWVASNTDANSVTRSGVARFASGAQIAIPANTDFNSPTGTICFWMQMPTPVNGNGTMLVDRRTSAGMVITVDGTGSGGLDIQYTGNASFAGGGNVVDGNWHHVAITYDQSASGNVTVYVDGSQTGSQANTAASSWPATQQIELGRSHDTYWQEYNGQMDDFRIYNRVLTSTEIGTIVSSDALVDTGALKVRYNFGTAAGVGTGLSWPLGVLQSTPALGSPAGWTTNSTTSAAYPMLPRTSVTNSAQFYRLKL
jgi:autotransporter-associated beta strand protein